MGFFFFSSFSAGGWTAGGSGASAFRRINSWFAVLFPKKFNLVPTFWDFGWAFLVWDSCCGIYVNGGCSGELAAIPNARVHVTNQRRRVGEVIREGESISDVLQKRTSGHGVHLGVRPYLNFSPRGEQSRPCFEEGSKCAEKAATVHVQASSARAQTYRLWAPC